MKVKIHNSPACEKLSDAIAFAVMTRINSKAYRDFEGEDTIYPCDSENSGVIEKESVEFFQIDVVEVVKFELSGNFYWTHDFNRCK